MSKRFGTLFDSPLFKENAENEEELKDEEEVGAGAEEATDDEFDAEEVAGEDLSYLDNIDEDEEESEGEGDDTEEEDFDDEDYDDSEEEDFDGEEEFEEGEDDEFSEGEEDFGDDDFGGEEGEGAEVGGEAPQLTSNTYDSGKAEEEPKMFYPSEEEVTLDVIEETGNGAVGDEAALTAMEMETPEAQSVEVGESQTELPEVPEEYNFEGVYNSEIEDFDNGFGANLETSTDDGMESDFDAEEDGDDFGTDEDEEFDSEEEDDFEDDDLGGDEDFGDEEEFDDTESDDVEAEGVDFDDDYDSEEDDEDFDVDTDGDDDFEDDEEDKE